MLPGCGERVRPRRGSCAPRHEPAASVHPRGDEDDQAVDQRIEVRIGVQHHEAVRRRLHENRAEDAADNAAAAAEQTRSAKYRSSDDGELFLVTEGRGRAPDLEAADKESSTFEPRGCLDKLFQVSALL